MTFLKIHIIAKKCFLIIKVDFWKCFYGCKNAKFAIKSPNLLLKVQIYYWKSKFHHFSSQVYKFHLNMFIYSHKIYLILYSRAWNSTTDIAIMKELSKSTSNLMTGGITGGIKMPKLKKKKLKSESKSSLLRSSADSLSTIDVLR